MRQYLPILLCIGVLMGAAPTKEGGNREDNELDGDWSCVLEVHDFYGNKLEGIPVGLTFKGPHLTVTHPARTLPSPRSSEVPIKIDTTQKPRHIDIAISDTWVKCLYEVKGDSLKICFAQTLERPMKLEASKEKGYDILVFKRVPKQGGVPNK